MNVRPIGLVLAAAVLSACSMLPAGRGETSTSPPPSDGPAQPQPHLGPAAGVADPYVDLATRLHARGVRVWWETDLVKRWLEGPASFAAAVDRLSVLAKVPGTAGFKVADEIGYGDGLRTPRDVQAFLRAAHDALARVAPGAPLLVDAVVPELGCLPWRGQPMDSCAQAARRQYPADTIAAVAGYLRSGLVDDLDLSSGLLDPSFYAARGLTADAAQQDAWAHVVAWGWSRWTHLRARKALAAPGGYQGSAADAAGDVRLYVDLPVGHGAASVDIWTWRQPYDGQMVSLLAPDLAPNPLWAALRRRHAAGVALFTHMTPSQMPTARAAFAHECDLAASVFTDVFVAAGTG